MRLTANYRNSNIRKLSNIVAVFQGVDMVIRTRPLFSQLVNDLGEKEEDVFLHWIITNEMFSEEGVKSGYYKLCFELCKVSTTPPGFTVIARNWKHLDEPSEEVAFKGPVFPDNDVECADFVLSELGCVVPHHP